MKQQFNKERFWEKNKQIVEIKNSINQDKTPVSSLTNRLDQAENKF